MDQEPGSISWTWSSAPYLCSPLRWHRSRSVLSPAAWPVGRSGGSCQSPTRCLLGYVCNMNNDYDYNNDYKNNNKKQSHQ